jgi:hypothetical protein
MPKKPTPPTPTDLSQLGEHGRALFDEIDAAFTFADPAERASVITLCGLADTAAALAERVNAEGVTQQSGSRVFVHPAATELRHTRNALASGLAVFSAAAHKDTAASSTSSASASKAARTRWARDGRSA